MFLAGVLALVLLAGSLAYYSSTVPVKNPLETDVYGSRTIEYFPPTPPLEPGSKVVKRVGAMNTGDYELVVRVSMEEEWSRNDVSLIKFSSIADRQKFNVPASLVAKQARGTAGETDGLITGDESVIHKELVGVTNGTWIDGGDGYWYYHTILPAKAETSLLMDALIAAKNMDMGRYSNSDEVVSTTAPATMQPLINVYTQKEAAFDTARTNYNNAKEEYEAQPTQAHKETMDAARVALNTARDELNTAYARADAAYAWKNPSEVAEGVSITYKMSANEITTDKGYADADYVLTVITDFCQADPNAVAEAWGAIPEAVTQAWGWTHS